MQDAAKAVRIVDRLKKLGVRISLDDFGTGYSSLAYLSRFAIDRLKIDQSFIRDITTNPINASIATATIAMAHKLGKIVIAEGVETEAQMQFLRRHDCDEMQGFLFSKALPADQFAALLQLGQASRLRARRARKPHRRRCCWSTTSRTSSTRCAGCFARRITVSSPPTAVPRRWNSWPSILSR